MLVDAHSGLAGIANWLNGHVLGADYAKQDALVAAMKEEVDRLYEDGRTTTMSDKELMEIYQKRSQGRD